MIVNESCLDSIPKWKQPKLIFADPPFNIRQDYEGFDDNKKEEEFVRFNNDWLSLCWKALDDGGVLAVHIPDEMINQVVLWEIVNTVPREAWIIWHYRFGQYTRYNWISSKCNCLVYRKPGGNPTWNPQDVVVKSDRSTKYKDKRINDTKNGGNRVPFDVWGIPSDGPYWGRVTKSNSERREGHPNQLPELYLSRLIRAYTNKGDLVADPFVGSGTTAVVADALGRKFVGCDISAFNVKSARQRVKEGAKRV